MHTSFILKGQMSVLIGCSNLDCLEIHSDWLDVHFNYLGIHSD